MIIIVYKEKTLLNKEIAGLYDPLTKGNGVAFIVSQKYSEFFALPFFPASRKIVTAYSTATNDPIPLEVWTPEMQKEADAAKSKAKGTWKLFMFWYLFIVVIGGAFVYTRMQAASKNKDEKMQTQYLANPQINDIVYANTFTEEGVMVSPFKIVAERGDTLFCLYSNESKPSNLDFLDKSKTVGAFDISDEKFGSDTLAFKKEAYGKRNLQPFIVKSDVPNYHTEIMYIQRPD